LIWGECEAEYFLKRDWTAQSLICPSGARSQKMPPRPVKARRVRLAVEMHGNSPSRFGEFNALSP
jgi:hypothetical protein